MAVSGSLFGETGTFVYESSSHVPKCSCTGCRGSKKEVGEQVEAVSFLIPNNFIGTHEEVSATAFRMLA